MMNWVCTFVIVAFMLEDNNLKTRKRMHSRLQFSTTTTSCTVIGSSRPLRPKIGKSRYRKWMNYFLRQKIGHSTRHNQTLVVIPNSEHFQSSYHSQKMLTMALFEPVSHCNIRPPFLGHVKRNRHSCPTIVIFCLRQTKIIVYTNCWHCNFLIILELKEWQ